MDKNQEIVKQIIGLVMLYGHDNPHWNYTRAKQLYNMVQQQDGVGFSTGFYEEATRAFSDAFLSGDKA